MEIQAVSHARIPAAALALVSPPAVLSRELDIWVADSVMPGQGVGATEGLLLCAKVTANLLLSGVVYRVFVPCEVVGPGEDCAAWFAGTGIDAIAAVGTSLRVQEAGRYWTGDFRVSCHRSHAVRLAMSFSLVLLQEGRCLESKCTTMVGAGVRSPVCSGSRRFGELDWCADRAVGGACRTKIRRYPRV